MPKVAPKVAQWAEDELSDMPLGANCFRLRVNFVTEEKMKAVRYSSVDAQNISACDKWGKERHCTEFYINQILEKYALHDTVFLTCFELGHGTDDAEGNPHYHTVFCSDYPIKTIRSAVAKIWRGNESYSLKKATTELVPEHLNYLCKGEGTGEDDFPKIVNASLHFTDERVTELHSLYWSNNDALKSASKKRKAASISEEIFTLCKHLSVPVERGQIYDIIRDHYGKRLKYWNPDYIRKLVYQTAMYLEPVDSKTNLDMKAYCVGLPFRPE